MLETKKILRAPPPFFLGGGVKLFLILCSKYATMNEKARNKNKNVPKETTRVLPEE